VLERIVRLSLPTLALIVGRGVTFSGWTGGTIAPVLATDASSPQVQAPAMFAVQCAGRHGEEGLGTAKGSALAMNQRVAEQSADEPFVLVEVLKRSRAVFNPQQFDGARHPIDHFPFVRLFQQYAQHCEDVKVLECGVAGDAHRSRRG
jgi:hypothetical protein